MSYAKSAAKTYSSQPTVSDPRLTEAWALTEAARRMAVAIEKPEERKEIRAAVRLNWRLWTIFQSELLDEGNPAPREIRDNMLQLCQFVDKHTISVLADPSPQSVQALIAVNRNIGAGLFEQTQSEAADTVPDAAQNSADNVTPFRINEIL